jgi:hypothetical protein
LNLYQNRQYTSKGGSQVEPKSAGLPSVRHVGTKHPNSGKP